MDKNNTYIRIGTTYYKNVNEPNIYDKNQTFKRLVKWDRASIIEDEGKEFLKKIKRYDGFINYPSHSNYQQSVKGFYNEYHELSGDIIEGDFPYTKIFLKHIFAEFYSISIDYLTLLWQRPTQHLPILCLVSKERNTGKTSFLNWLTMLFEDNVAIIKKADFKSNFNNSWVNKLIIAVDEAKFDRKDETDYIKELSTSKTQQREKKGVDKKQENFFGKIILASNNVDNFVVIDKEEIRFWVIEVSSVTNKIDDLEEKLKEELPHVKYFFQNREITYPKSSRMWFKPSDIKTDALKQVVKNSHDVDEKELAIIINEYVEMSEKESVKLALKDIKFLAEQNRSFVSNSTITKILKDKWSLNPSDNATTYKFYHKTYDGYSDMSHLNETDKKGRVYEFKKEFIQSLI